MRFVCQESLLPGATSRDKFAAAVTMGLDGIEVWGPSLRASPGLYQELSEEFGLPITTICLGYDGNLLDALPVEREKAMKSIVEVLRLGDKLGGAQMIVPPCFGGPRISDLSPMKTAIDLEYELLVVELKMIAKEVEGLRSRLLLEPLNRYETHFMNTVGKAVETADLVGSPNVGVMADFFHMSIEEDSIPQTIVKHGRKVDHYHLADSNRRLPGQGHTDFRTCLKLIRDTGFQGTLAFEVKAPENPGEAIPRSLEYLKFCLR